MRQAHEAQGAGHRVHVAAVGAALDALWRRDAGPPAPPLYYEHMRGRLTAPRGFACVLALSCGVALGVGVGCATDPSPRAGPAPTSDGAALLREAIEVIRSRALGGDRIDWMKAEHELLAALPADASVARARPLVAEAVRRLGDPHATVKLAAEASTAPRGAPRGEQGAGAGQQSNPGPRQTPPIPSRAVATVLEDGVAYVLIPGCAEPTVEGLRDYATVLRAELLAAAAGSPKGWVIDLRLNGGGNLWPMMLGLQPLLGEGVMMTSLRRGDGPARFGLSRDAAWIDWGGGPETQLDFGERSPPPVRLGGARVAVIIGPWTMSSGEATAICLRTVPGSRVFGERSAGLTTVTKDFELRDGSVLVLPVSVMGDRAGVPVSGALVPDEAVESDSWPGADDAPGRAARGWVLRGSH